MRKLFIGALFLLSLLCLALTWSIVVDASDLTRFLGMNVERQEALIVIASCMIVTSVAALWAYLILRGRGKPSTTS